MALITGSLLDGVHACFRRYADTFRDGDGRLPGPLQLKLDHSRRVAEEMASLAAEMDWPIQDRRAAEVLGLLHDTGRFVQYREQGHFADSAACDHGKLGRRRVAAEGWLEEWPEETGEAILEGIRLHHERRMPPELTGRPRDYTALIRDADKLDIMGIVAGAVERDGFRELPVMLPGLTLDRAPTAAFLDGLFHGDGADLKRAASLGDFLMMQVSWVRG
ncbi:HD domain-containing protein [Kiritimatiella glycovorans]|uniref:Putative HD superfamily hydrolase n=1 Tax=Kiritimatiella glycovorans TaxID=1307763 RepID=A0A0G3EF54_9BACT|nr:HD domain-containing protein [Kiritimatiella glycovorans]AKJ63400.1 putative HD superfamily hydrolase [Kiritimatiella glycovorans]